MTAKATPRGRWIRPLAGAALGVMALAGAAVAQPLPRQPEPAKLPEKPPAPAAPRPVVGVIDLRADKDSKELVNALSAAIGRRAELQTVANVRVANALAGDLDDDDTKKTAAAREQLDKAREQMANFQLERAVEHAQEGRNQLLATTPSPSATSLLADLAFTEGQARFANREKDKARVAFTLVHRLAPGRTLDPNRYLPELIAAFVAAATPPAGDATLEITAEGTVWLDGHPQGAGKQTLKVSPGTHLVISSGPELIPVGERVDVVAGETKRIVLTKSEATVDVKTFRARKALIGAPDATARAGAMKQIAELAQMTDAVIVAVDAKGGPAVQLWRNRAPGFQEIKTVPRTLTPEEADRIIAPLVPPKPDPIDDTPDIVIPIRPPAPKEWYQKRWVQAGLVGGAIAVVAGFFWVRDAIGTESRLCCGGVDEIQVGRE